MSRNAEVASLLEEFADRLEAEGVDYKPRAYRRAAGNVRSHAVGVEVLYEEGGEDAIAEIEGVGDAISAKIAEYVETGEIEELEELRAEMPADVEALTAVEGVGPKTVRELYDALGIETLDDLEEAARAGRIREVEGFGEKTEQNILENVDFARQSRRRSLLGEARPVGEDVVAYVGGIGATERCELAGSLRRWRPTIGDVDVLAASEDPEAVVEAFTGWDRADEVIEAGTIKASVRSDGMRVDLQVVDPEEFGSALQYFTGSKEHNVHLRNVAIDRDLKMNEYGVFDVSGQSPDGSSDSSDEVAGVDDPDAGQRVGERIAGETEASMYAALDMPVMPPELREDRGEIEAAMDGELPDLVAVDDVRGDLHTHTEWSDGDATVAEMVAGAAEFGHDYVAICDHATGPGMVGGVGLDDDELRDQLREVREVADDADIDVFAGVEANVDAEGNVSVADDVLADLDLVVASPHSGLEGDGTGRLLAAVEHPHVDVVGHPTGRLLHSRSGMDVDVERLAAAAAEERVALEVNAHPARLDLSGRAVQIAVDQGATVAVDTDAHRPAEYEYVRYGVHTARRGWAEPGDVLNARDADGVRAFLDG